MNPLLTASTLQYEYPPFDKIDLEHFEPSFMQGIDEHLAEISKIVDNTEAANFENTIVAMEKAGETISRTSNVFYNRSGTMSNERLREVELKITTPLSEYNDAIYLNGKLFAKVQAVYDARDSLDAEDRRVTELWYKNFVRAGAQLSEEAKDRIRQINIRSDNLSNLYSQKMLSVTENNLLVLDTVEELAGLDEGSIKAAQELAEKKGYAGKFALQLLNTSRHFQLAELKNAATREKLLTWSHSRCEDPKNDSSALIVELLKLRAEKAELLGYTHWSAYRLENEMAGTPEKALALLVDMVPAVTANVDKRAEELLALKKRDGDDSPLRASDWEFYEEKLKSDKFQFDFSTLSSYLPLEKCLSLVFRTFGDLYGIRFEESFDLPKYHPDSRIYEVFDIKSGESIALFVTDYFARAEGKSGGAWMQSFVEQSSILSKKPVVVNVMNIPQKDPQFVDFDNFSTLFHELGHGVHGMLSQVRYPSVSGTNVATDYVEFPSTLHEDFIYNADILADLAHNTTGEKIPQELIEKMQLVSKFNQGYDTFEYLSAAIVDISVHQMTLKELNEMFPTNEDNYKGLVELEDKIRQKYNINHPLVASRYKLTYFSHSMGGYSSAYYAYLWSEVFAADGFAYINEGGKINQERSQSFKKEVLLTGNSRDPMESFIKFRGKNATPEALLIRRGISA